MSFAWRLETLIKIGIIVGVTSRFGGRITMKQRTAKFNLSIRNAIMRCWLRMINKSHGDDGCRGGH
jgi:hypothetical protein